MCGGHLGIEKGVEEQTEKSGWGSEPAPERESGYANEQGMMVMMMSGYEPG